jgi:hypothetical protein
MEPREIDFNETVSEVREYWEEKAKPFMADEDEEWDDLPVKEQIHIAVMYGVDLATRGVEDGE